MNENTHSRMEVIDATKCACGRFADHRLVLLLSTLGGKLTRKQKASRSIPICKACVRKGGVVGSVSLRQSLKAVLTRCATACICLCALPLVFSMTGCAGAATVRAHPGKPVRHIKAPEGYTQNGYCIPDGMNAKTGLYDFLVCRTDDGATHTYKLQS